MRICSESQMGVRSSSGLLFSYGKGILQDISERLQPEFRAGFSMRNLRQMKRIFAMFPDANALSPQLT